MAKRRWLDEVRQRLARRALPPAYIGRFMDELSDHFQDLTEESMSTEASVLSRLGDPAQVAEAAVTAYRQRSFLGRHPAAALLVFGISPAASLIALTVASLWVVCTTADLPCIPSLRSMPRWPVRILPAVGSRTASRCGWVPGPSCCEG